MPPDLFATLHTHDGRLDLMLSLPVRRLLLAWLRLRSLARCLTGHHPVAWLIARGQWATLDALLEDLP